MKIAVIGTGYVGLTQGACMAEIGHEVTCVDIDTDKINRLRSGDVVIYEPGLDAMVKRNYEGKRLHFTTDSKTAIEIADVVYSAVGTPPDKDYRADLTAVKIVAREFGKHVNNYKLFINKSTVPVGTGAVCKELIAEELAKRNENIEFDVVSNPEFMREGVAILDCLKPDRIVVGSESKKAIKLMKKLNLPIIEKGATFFTTNIESAEVIKYAANAMLATKISFMNEIANLCERVGANITDVEKGVGLDHRIGRRFLHAGIGYGGSCFPKDVGALVATGADNGYHFQIIDAVQRINESQKGILVQKLQERFPDLKGKKIAIWGLSFKPKTDDIRDSSAHIVIQQLLDKGAAVSAFDPVAMENMKSAFPDIKYNETALEAVEEADALLLVTDWDEFRGVDFDEIRKHMKGSVIGDGRNIWQPQEVRAAGFDYFSIGRQ